MMTAKLQMVVEKWSGAGNTFLITETPFWKEHDLTDFITRICSPLSGFAVDGIVGLEDLKGREKNQWRWHFFNADGSHAEMCGNAARCAVAFLLKKVPNAEIINISTGRFEISGSRESTGLIKVSFPISKNIKSSLLPGAVWSGVPHLLVEIDEQQFWDLEKRAELRQRAAPLRAQQAFSESSGTNVTYWSKRAQRDYFAVTFERGVENFTQACGTGAIAVAIGSVLVEQANFDFQSASIAPVNVEMPGGALQVYFSKGRIFLAGEAVEHFAAEMISIPKKGSQ